MRSIAIRTRDGGSAQISPLQLDSLERELTGTLLTPVAADYDGARKVWNGMIERRPALIARCATEGDVIRTVHLAREHRLLTAVRGGGHNIAGTGVCDGGLVIDLSGMRGVEIDTDRRTARVEPGCTLADLDASTQAFGLATPLGINSTTGVAGLTLGGGFGWLSRKHGMTIDNLLSASLVTAAGEVARASDVENPDLFWAVRGGGGNFGVATSFEYRLHPVGPEVIAGLIVHPLDAGPGLLRHYRDFIAEAPDELTAWVVLRHAPPLPFLSQEWHGKPVVVIAVFYAGQAERGERALEPLRRFGTPIADVVGSKPYTAWQQAFDPLLESGARNYWKSHDFTEISDAAIDLVLDHAAQLPTVESEIFLAQIGGAMGSVPVGAMAYPHRSTRFVLNLHTRWREPARDADHIAWTRRAFDAATPHASGGVYVNFMTAEERDRVAAAYGPNYPRLAAIKARYDPENLFRMNQNIQPGGDGSTTSPEAIPPNAV